MEEKLKISKSEAIYKVLTSSIRASNDYYEKESFVYHHSICKHDMQDYVLNIDSDHMSNKVIWIFKNNNSNSRLRYCPFSYLNKKEIESLKRTENKTNLLINYILSN